MHDAEPLKPSNTGWLIADVVEQTHAFGWARTEADAGLLALLDDPQWQPYVVFPGEFVEPPQRVVHALPAPRAGVEPNQGRRPLFILLDATWPEARKMFRKSPYLDRFPGAEPAPGPGVAVPSAPLPARRPFLHQRGAALCLELTGDGGDRPRAARWRATWRCSPNTICAPRTSSRCRQTVTRAVVCRTRSLPFVRLLVKNDSGRCWCSLGLVAFCSKLLTAHPTPLALCSPVAQQGGAGRREAGHSSAGGNFLLRSGRGGLPILAACDERWTGGGAG